jgi:hypothetical protein
LSAPLMRGLQAMLAGLYDAPAELDVHDYLITDAAHAAALQGAAGAPPTDEQLLLAEDEDGMGVSLYVDQAVLERLMARCPLRTLSDDNLADYCTALEGVSHFHYLVWSAVRARRVSLLELELQGEVDKYASALRLMLSQRDGRFPADLYQRLFERATFLPSLSAAERQRYEEAHRCAARFCRRLEERFLRCRRARPEALVGELRAFYRRGGHAKLHYAESWR